MSTLAYQVPKEAGNVYIADAQGERAYVQALTASYDVSAQDSGKTFLLNATAAIAVTLPAVATAGSGFRVKFVVKTAASSGGHTITEATASDTDVIIGSFSVADVTGDNGASSTGCTTITIGTGADKGAWVELLCDGSNWIVSGCATAAADLALA